MSYVANHSKQRKTTKVIKIQWLASIWCQKWSNYDEFAPIWRQNDLKCWGSRKTLKTTQNYKSNQITINCIDLMSKTAKQSKTTKAIKLRELHQFEVKTIKKRKTTKVIKIQWLSPIWGPNDQNNAKLRKWSNYNELHRFDVKTI